MNIVGALILIHVGIATNIIGVKGENKIERVHNTAIVVFILLAAAWAGFLFVTV